jgi:hypothetical protein
VRESSQTGDGTALCQIANLTCLLAQDWQRSDGTDLFVAANITSGGSPTTALRSRYVLGGGEVENVTPSCGPLYLSPVLEKGRDRLPAGAGARLHLDECRSLSTASPFGALVRETAGRMAVEPRALAVRALLELPRVASYRGWVKTLQVQRELRISAERLRRDARAAIGYVPAKRFELRDLVFEEIEPSRALPVLTTLHYLRSARPGSLYFALVDPIARLPVTLCSVSPLQWKCVGSEILAQSAIPPARVLDISRLYSVNNAPTNAISSLLSKVRTYLHHNMPAIDLLVTAVDPNLGFTGTSYRAANWQKWMTVRARPYLYEKGHYVSPRQLREHYGTSSLVDLRAKYPGRFQQSRARLLDTIIYCCSVNGETRVVPAEDIPRLHR